MTPPTLKERLTWYSAGEDRSWKRRFQAVELVVLVGLILTSVVAVALAPSPPKLLSMFHLLAAGFSVTQIALVPFFLRDTRMPRYARSLILFGFLCGAGGLAGFALLLFVAASTT